MRNTDVRGSCGVTANCARSLLASPWRMRTLPLEDVYSYQDSVESTVDEALTHLPGKYRAVIHLFYYEGYQTEEIARILGRSPSTVRAQLTGPGRSCGHC